MHDFTDVTEPEKLFFILWNRYIRSDTIIAKKKVPWLCAMFVEKYTQTLLDENLTHQLLLHLMNFVDFGMINEDHLQKIMQRHYFLSAEIKQKQKKEEKNSNLTTETTQEGHSSKAKGMQK